MKTVRTLSLALAAVLLLMPLAACSRGTGDAYSYVAMDTVFSIKCGIGDETAKADALTGCLSLTGEIEGALSSPENGAEAERFNESADGLTDASEILRSVTKSALEYSSLTDGAFDPTVGALTELWNVTGGGPVPSDEAIAGALGACGRKYVTVTDTGIEKSDASVKLDLGAVGKGYAAARICEYLTEKGAEWGIVSAGRTVGVFGEKPDGGAWKIGVCDPRDTASVLGYLYVNGGYVSVSGDYERYFEENGVRYHHIMDPETGRPADSGLSSVVVLSPNGTAADALSTALFVMGKDKALAFYESGKTVFEAIFTGTDGSVTLTPGLRGGSVFELASDNYKLTEN